MAQAGLLDITKPPVAAKVAQAKTIAELARSYAALRRGEQELADLVDSRNAHIIEVLGKYPEGTNLQEERKKVWQLWLKARDLVDPEITPLENTLSTLGDDLGHVEEAITYLPSQTVAEVALKVAIYRRIARPVSATDRDWSDAALDSILADIERLGGK